MDLSGVLQNFSNEKRVTAFAPRTLDRHKDMILSKPVTKFIFVVRNRRHNTLELEILLPRKH